MVRNKLLFNVLHCCFGQAVRIQMTFKCYYMLDAWNTALRKKDAFYCSTQLSTCAYLCLFCSHVSLKLVWQSDKNKHYSLAPAMGLRLPSMGFFAVTFYFYSVMTQAGAHSAQQARWISVFTKSTVGRNSRLCGCLQGEEQAWKKACVVWAKWSWESSF